MYKMKFMTPAIHAFHNIHNTGSPHMLLKAHLLFFFGLVQNLETFNYFLISTQYSMSLSETIPVSLCLLIFTPHENTCQRCLISVWA